MAVVLHPLRHPSLVPAVPNISTDVSAWSNTGPGSGSTGTTPVTTPRRGALSRSPSAPSGPRPRPSVKARQAPTSESSRPSTSRSASISVAPSFTATTSREARVLLPDTTRSTSPSAKRLSGARQLSISTIKSMSAMPAGVKTPPPRSPQSEAPASPGRGADLPPSPPRKPAPLKTVTRPTFAVEVRDPSGSRLPTSDVVETARSGSGSEWEDERDDMDTKSISQYSRVSSAVVGLAVRQPLRLVTPSRRQKFIVVNAEPTEPPSPVSPVPYTAPPTSSRSALAASSSRRSDRKSTHRSRGSRRSRHAANRLSVISNVTSGSVLPTFAMSMDAAAEAIPRPESPDLLHPLYTRDAGRGRQPLGPMPQLLHVQEADPWDRLATQENAKAAQRLGLDDEDNVVYMENLPLRRFQPLPSSPLPQQSRFSKPPKRLFRALRFWSRKSSR